MNAEELKRLVLAKKIPEDTDKLLNEAREFMKAKGMTEKEIEVYAVQQVHSLLKKQLNSDAASFEAIFFGIDKVGDWNKKEHAKKTELWEKSDDDKRKAMIEEGLFNEEGQPLNVGKFGDGKPIDPTQIKRTIWLAEKDEEGAVKIGRLNLWRSAIDMLPKLFVPIKFRANLSSNTAEDGVKLLNSASVTKFDNAVGTEINFKEFAENHLKQYHKPTASITVEDHNKYVLLDDFTISSVNLANNPANNNVIKITAVDSALDDGMITCWLPNFFELPAEDTPGSVLFGRVQRSENKQTGEVSATIQVLGLWVMPAFRVDVKPEPIPEATATDATEEGW